MTVELNVIANEAWQSRCLKHYETARLLCSIAHFSRIFGSLGIGVVVVENVRSTFSTTTTENPGEPHFQALWELPWF